MPPQKIRVRPPLVVLFIVILVEERKSIINVLYNQSITNNSIWKRQNPIPNSKKGREEEQRREQIMVVGFGLFAKYYQSLWD